MISAVENDQIRVLEKILHGIMITDMQGLIIYSNNANAKIFGYSISDIRGMSIQTLYSEKDEMTVSNIMNKVKKTILFICDGTAFKRPVSVSGLRSVPAACPVKMENLIPVSFHFTKSIP